MSIKPGRSIPSVYPRYHGHLGLIRYGLSHGFFYIEVFKRVTKTDARAFS